MAAVVPRGGAGTVRALTGLVVPVCRAKVPSLPGRSAVVHPVKPDSKPPLLINSSTSARAARPPSPSARRNAAAAHGPIHRVLSTLSPPEDGRRGRGGADPGAV